MADKTEGRYSFQVTDRKGDKFCDNALRFDTPEDANEYGCNLRSRWMAIKEWQVFDYELNQVVEGYSGEY